MCGIVALIGSREAAPQLLEGLRQLEYRGYDSAGIATIGEEGQLHCLVQGGLVVEAQLALEGQHDRAVARHGGSQSRASLAGTAVSARIRQPGPHNESAA
jgi:glucosamine 6-phosphate synthetase-like amidotransferase/phosphosugar isomerase protein